MSDASRLVPWVCDVALAYALGLVVGAPVALAAVWLTGEDRLATVSLLGGMALVLAVLRRGRSGASVSTGSARLAGRSSPFARRPAA